jgi:hypothetical protein
LEVAGACSSATPSLGGGERLVPRNYADQHLILPSEVQAEVKFSEAPLEEMRSSAIASAVNRSSDGNDAWRNEQKVAGKSSSNWRALFRSKGRNDHV